MFYILLAIGTALWCFGEIFNPFRSGKGRKGKF